MHEATNININLLDTDRAPITGPLTDAQSQVFSVNIGINPLIAAATPLLATISEIEQQHEIIAADLSCKLQREIKAFENSAHKNNYSSQVILASRYLLCSLIDESIINSHPNLNWQLHSLLYQFQHERWGGERFFVILERSFESPNTYIDLLELGYICLSLGFKGKYTQPTQLRELGIFIDQLYQIIEQQRGEQQPALKNKLNTTPHNHWHLPPWWAIVIGCGLILSSIFIPYTLKLNKTITPLAYNLNHYE